MSRPAFRPAEIEAERQVILEELLMHADEPDEIVHDLLLDGLFPGHPLGRDVLGSEQTITAMTGDDIARFFRDHYGPSNLVMAAAGAVDHDALVASIAERLSPPPGGATITRVAPAASADAVRVVQRPTEQAHLVVGVRSIDVHDDDRFAVAVVNHILGGGLSSRLFQSIREERGLAYSVYSYRTAFVDAGVLAVYAGTAPNHTGEVLQLIEAELDRMAADGVTAAEVDVARAHMLGATALSLEDSGARMARIGRGFLVHDEVWTNAQVEEHIASVTLDDVNRAIARILDGAPRTVAAIGPFDRAEVDGLRAAS